MSILVRLFTKQTMTQSYFQLLGKTYSNSERIRYYVRRCLGLVKLMMLFAGEPGIIRQTQNGNVDLISIEAMFGVDPTPT